MKEIIENYKKHHRFANYLSAAQLYLKDNFFLEEKLKSEHIKKRILGHWGTVPGINFIYGGLNHIVKKYNRKTLFVNGPGHGAPAILSNLLLEGSLGEYYPDYQPNKEGMEKLIKNFSWPLGFPSHTYPGIPGTILEGGELGYSLATAVGAAFDNPDLLVACLIGDGEAETGTLSSSWHSNKFLHPERDGAVLPILHLNGYRISGPTIFGTMSKQEIYNYFTGLGYEPLWVDYDEAVDVYVDMLQILIRAYEKISNIKAKWRTYEVNQPKWPVIILKTPKGWTGVKSFKGEKVEGNNLSHGIPLKNPKYDPAELSQLENWLESYKIEELLDKYYRLKAEILSIIPERELRMGMNPHANGGKIKKKLLLPQLEDHEMKVFKRGQRPESMMKNLGQYTRDIFDLNENNKNFRIFSPDESESNMLEPIFTETDRCYLWPIHPWDKYISEDGRMLEILNENVLTAWMQGYNLTGRYGAMISYEAFLTIVTSQIQQYIKFLTKSKLHKWRDPIPSLNFISTSTTWRQDHNGFSHQNPGLINTLLSMQTNFVSVYFPADVNTLLATMDDSYKRTDNVNLVISGKRDLPQWLKMPEAIQHVERGVSIWGWVGNENQDHDADPDVVLVSAGDYQTQETLAAISILREMAPELVVRYVNVNELTKFGIGDEKDPAMSDSEIRELFTDSREVIFNFHGYPEVIKQLTWGHELSYRLKILGYIEEGTTTTPFDMQVQNHTSRYHVCMEAISAAAKVNDSVRNQEADLLYFFERKLREHKEFILEHGDDLPEVKKWEWKE